MNDILKGNASTLITRTPGLIAAEIIDIKAQTRKMVLYNSIEIGRRLVEAKSLLDHGEWGEWLEKSVDYSQSTANNLMRIFEEYGADQITLLTDMNAKSQALGNLSYTQAIALLGIPEEEREKFISENDIDSMSTRELQQAIKDLKQAKDEQEKLQQEKVLAEEALGKAVSDLDKAQKEKQETDKKLQSLTIETDKLTKQLAEESKKGDKELQKQMQDLEKKQKELDKLKEKIKELETKSLEVHKGATDDDIAKIKAEAEEKYEKEMAVLKVEKEQAEKRIKELEIKTSQQNNAAALKYQVYFDELVKSFKEILQSLSEVKETDEATYERYRDAVSKLISKMSERL